ncbi:MAG TPA: hypothetical protein DD636_09580 [Anaerolineaceae bacterium]|jgi:RHS repeat-associated protein|nr:hypothetical protein [Anaerolineaceae bacterium]
MNDSSHGITYLYGDHLGSTHVTADKEGAMTSQALYQPWGETRYQTGASPTDYGYTGQMQEGDLYYYGARWYDPLLGRFIQPDTIVPSAQGTQAFDRYAYVNNNPLKYTDPSGHWVETALDIAFIFFDLQQISQEGWTPVNTLALVADVTCAIIPFGTGGGPGVRLAFAGADASVGITRAAIQVPEAIRFGQTIEKGLQFFADQEFATQNPTNEPNSTSSQIGSTGQIGQDYLDSHYIGASQPKKYFKIPGKGGRFPDFFTDAGKAIEAKVGSTSQTSRVSAQVMKDAYLFENGFYKSVEWQFFRSPVTGRIGPTQPLIDFLDLNKIPWRFIE